MAGSDLEIFFSRMETGRVTKSFPEITTMSIAGSKRSLMRRNTSRIFRLARFLATAFPIFFEAIIPSLCLSNPLGRVNRVHVLSILFLWPWLSTLSNWGRLVSRSFLLKVYPSMHQTASRLRPFRLRLAKILLPPTVDVLLRNPWVLFLLRFLGWKVRFILIPSI